MDVDKTYIFCDSTDVEEICKYRTRYLFLCRCCGKDFSVAKPQAQQDREREAPPEERWR